MTFANSRIPLWHLARGHMDEPSVHLSYQPLEEGASKGVPLNRLNISKAGPEKGLPEYASQHSTRRPTGHPTQDFAVRPGHDEPR
jgi:hypothetical protein